jgi:cytochrome c oxidase subunit 2
MREQTWPALATSQSHALASNWTLFLIVGSCVAVLVWGLIVFALIRYRRSATSGAPPQFSNNYPLEIAWTAIPLVLVCALFIHTYTVESRVDAVVARPDVLVHVNAYRWGWRFVYAGGPTVGGAASSPIGGNPVSAKPELVLPLGETTRIELSSDDVTHSFWVPDFLFKRDAIPGQTSGFDLQPTRTGTFLGRCAQFCGLNHALMQFTVRVVPPTEFLRWRKEVALR